MTGTGIHVPTHKDEEAGEMAPETPREEKPEAALGPAPTAPARKGLSLGAIGPFFIEYYREMSRGIKWLRAAPKPEVLPRQRAKKGFVLWSKARKARIGIVATLGIIIASYGLFSVQAASTPTLPCPPESCGGGGGGGGGTGNNASTWVNGTVAENSDEASTVDVEHTRLASFMITLTWMDEPGRTLQVNQPDSLGFNVSAPNGYSVDVGPATNPAGGTGSLSWSLPENMTGTDLGGTQWTITVQGGAMGDPRPPSGRPCPVLCTPDTSNAYSLKVEWTW
jgi:hypothetical protein